MVVWSQVSGIPAYKLNGVQRDLITSRIRDDPASLSRWKRALRTWLERGWNPVNVAGQVDVYEHGIKGLSRKTESSRVDYDSLVVGRET